MVIDADRLAQQVKLAYDFMDALHGQAIALLKDVEAQLADAPAKLRCLKPGGYRYTINPLTYGLERPRTFIADYYALCFRRFSGREKNTPLDRKVKPIAFVKVVLREGDLKNPEVRLGIMTEITKNPERKGKRPRKFEDHVSNVFHRALTGSDWHDQHKVMQSFDDGHVRLTVQGRSVKLAGLPDSEAVKKQIVDPLLKMYRDATQ